MTAPAPAPTSSPSPNTHLIVGGIGLVTGVLAMVQAYFGSGHIPSSAEVSGLLGGAGISISSVVGMILAHVHITKTQAAVFAGDAEKLLPVAQALVSQVPALQTAVATGEGRIKALEDALPAGVGVDIKALAAAVKTEILNPSPTPGG